MDSRNVGPAVVLVALDDVARKVDDRVLAAGRLENVGAMNHRHSSGHCQPVEFLDDERIIMISN